MKTEEWHSLWNQEVVEREPIIGILCAVEYANEQGQTEVRVPAWAYWCMIAQGTIAKYATYGEGFRFTWAPMGLVIDGVQVIPVTE